MKKTLLLFATISVNINMFATCPNPVITMNPASSQVCVGANAIFSIMANGTGLTYQWQADAGSGFTNLSNTPPYGAVSSNMLNIAFITTALNGYQYRCVATDSCSNTVTSI